MAQSVLYDILASLGVCLLLILVLFCIVRIAKMWKAWIFKRVQAELRKRRNTKDTFRQDNGYSWDYFMAFRIYEHDEIITDDQAIYNMTYVLDKLTAAGLETRIFYSITHQEVYCKIRCSLPRLQKFADLIEYQLEMDPEKLQAACQKGTDLWDGLKIPLECPETNLHPYTHIYCQYKWDPDTRKTDRFLFPLYKSKVSSKSCEDTPGLTLVNTRDSEDDVLKAALAGPVEHLPVESSIFSSADRLKIINEIIKDSTYGGAGLDPQSLALQGCILSYTPMHDIIDLTQLQVSWVVVWQAPWSQPTTAIKNYFGEKIGLYFEWLGLYTTYLTIAAAFGIAVWINIAIKNNDPSSASVPYFAAFMAVWSTLFLEQWKRRENTLALEWGMIGFEDVESDRPQFYGDKIRSPVDGKVHKHFTLLQRLPLTLRSYAIIFGCCLGALGVIAAILAFKAALNKTEAVLFGTDIGSSIGAILLAIQIQVFNGFFNKIAIELNGNENHRTDTQYEDALISKIFVFQFVNSYGALFYIAFIEPNLIFSDPCVDGCMSELQFTLGIIFITRLVLGNIEEIGLPLVDYLIHKNIRKNSGDDVKVQSTTRGQSVSGLEMENLVVGEGPTFTVDPKTDMSEVERMFLMAEYDTMLGSLDDYAEMALQFGYSTMFVAAFPLSTVMALVNNYVEIRVDAWKLCQLLRRPIPRGAEDIGTWQSVFEIVASIAVFTNAAIVAFTARNVIDYTWAVRTWIFICMSSGIYGLRLLIQIVIPDVPEDTVIQTRRQEYIVGKLIDNIEDGEELLRKDYLAPAYLVLASDHDVQ